MAQLRASKERRRKVRLPEYEGHLWLGDHGCFWARHQEEDPLARATYERVRGAPSATPDDYEDVEVLLEEAEAT